MKEQKYSYFKEDGTQVIIIPDWMKNLSVDEQIQYQVKLTKEEHPEYHCMVAYTYEKDINNSVKISRHTIEI